jgi:hypothetical protein
VMLNETCLTTLEQIYVDSFKIKYFISNCSYKVVAFSSGNFPKREAEHVEINVLQKHS